MAEVRLIGTRAPEGRAHWRPPGTCGVRMMVELIASIVKNIVREAF